MNDALTGNGISWDNCIGVSVDNTSVNLGKRNSIMTRVKQKNAASYFMGCPCHILHNTCIKVAEVFAKVMKIVLKLLTFVIINWHRKLNLKWRK